MITFTKNPNKMQKLCLVLHTIRNIFKLLNKKKYECNSFFEHCNARKKPPNKWTKIACWVDWNNINHGLTVRYSIGLSSTSCIKRSNHYRATLYSIKSLNNTRRILDWFRILQRGKGLPFKIKQLRIIKKHQSNEKKGLQQTCCVLIGVTICQPVIHRGPLPDPRPFMLLSINVHNLCRIMKQDNSSRRFV